VSERAASAEARESPAAASTEGATSGAGTMGTSDEGQKLTAVITSERLGLTLEYTMSLSVQCSHEGSSGASGSR